MIPVPAAAERNTNIAADGKKKHKMSVKRGFVFFFEHCQNWREKKEMALINIPNPCIIMWNN